MKSTAIFVPLICGLYLAQISSGLKYKFSVTVQNSWFQKMTVDENGYSRSLIFRLNTDVGPICLAGEESNGFDVKFYLADCVNSTSADALFCAGPGGPATVWTKRSVRLSIVSCISNVLKDGEKLKDFTEDEFRKLVKSRPMVVRNRGKPSKKNLAIKLDDPNRSIPKALTNGGGFYVKVVLIFSTDKNIEIVKVEVKNIIPEFGIICLAPNSTHKEMHVNARKYLGDYGCRSIAMTNYPEEIMTSLTHENLKSEVLMYLGRHTPQNKLRLVFYREDGNTPFDLEWGQETYMVYDNRHLEL